MVFKAAGLRLLCELLEERRLQRRVLDDVAQVGHRSATTAANARGGHGGGVVGGVPRHERAIAAAPTALAALPWGETTTHGGRGGHRRRSHMVPRRLSRGKTPSRCLHLPHLGPYLHGGVGRGAACGNEGLPRADGVEELNLRSTTGQRQATCPAGSTRQAKWVSSRGASAVPRYTTRTFERGRREEFWHAVSAPDECLPSPAHASHTSLRVGDERACYACLTEAGVIA